MNPGTEPHASRLTPLVTFAACAVVLGLRAAPRLAHPALWAEDGAVFLKDALEQGWTPWLPYAGYLHVVPRPPALFTHLPLAPDGWGFGYTGR